MAAAKLGVAGRPKVGEDTLEECTVELGRASRDGERPPPGGSGEEDRGGAPPPTYFFCVKVKENMACDRED